jgi:asparagine synthase (glutamine-hydrolysing)
MGGFLLIKKPEAITAEETEKLYSDSINVFERKGLRLNKRIVIKEFVVYVFHKNKFQVDNAIVFDHDQFVISTGTCLYDGKTGYDALKQLYNDFSEKGEFLYNLCGHYCLIISKAGKLYLLNDYTGLYHVFSNTDKTVISSSFLAILKSLKDRNISRQELYEHVINGACFGGRTLIKEIDLLDSKSVWQLSPGLLAIPKPRPEPPYVKRLEKVASFDELVRMFAADLIEYFSILKENFGNNICSALTGGFDTRLMLALMKKVGIKPSYLYVYGDENNTVGRDAYAVVIAKSIAKAEGIALHQIDKNKFLEFPENEFEELLKRTYYLKDGLGHEWGLFDNGSDLATRLERAGNGKLQLNGAGGETFRNYWALPDRRYNIKSFLKSRFDRVDYSICSDGFDQTSYFSALKDKIKTSLSTYEDRINRRQMELIQPEFENKYWLGNNVSINNTLSYALTPFADVQFVFQACDIPIRFKHLGVFEAALIKFIDPSLAKYPSSHGYNFYDNIDLRTKIRYFARLNLPLWLKVYVKKHYYDQVDERLTLRRNKLVLPFYLSRSYLDKIFLSKDLAISEYFHIDKINNPQVLSRALSAELVITDRF